MKHKFKALALSMLLILAILAEGNLHAQNLDLKIMSYNMQQPYGTNWDGRKANAAQIINAYQGDVVGTQELVNYQRDYVMANTTGYAVYGQGRDCGDNGEGSWILYKTAKYTLDAANSGNFWFSDNPTVCGRGWDPNYSRVCTYVRLIDKATGKAFYVFNAHFPTPEQSTARTKSIQLLCARVAARAFTNDQVIITGDFNSLETETQINYIKTGASNPSKMRDSYRDLYPSGNVTTGFGVKFDYIFIENKTNVSALASQVITSPVASDHMPITATIRLGSGTPPPPPVSLPIAGKIEAENFSSMNGVQTENATDVGGGTNVGFLDPGDWLEYKVNVSATGNYKLDFRIAAQAAAGQLQFLVDGGILKTQNFPATGGWQTWQTVSTTVNLNAGEHTIRLNITTGNFNINWMNFALAVNVAPSIGITAPLANASYNAPASIKIDANATDSDGTVSVVNFYNGTTLLGSDNTAPYSFTWVGVAAGSYTISASATDNEGAVTNATAANVVVSNVATGALEVKIVSFNLWWGNNWDTQRKFSAANLINGESADVVGLQEADEAKERSDLMAACPGYKLEVGTFTNRGESTPIMYKDNIVLIERGTFGYSSQPDNQNVSDWGDGAGYGWLRVCNWALFEKNGKRFYVYNNHMDANGFSNDPQYWRLKEAQLLCQRIAARKYPEYPFIVIGDLNGVETEPATVYYKTGADNPVKMVDTYRVINPAGSGNTFGGVKYDYILVENSTKVQTLEAKIIEHNVYGWTSDHYQVNATIRFSDVALPITSFPIPGKIEAEKYAAMNGIQIETTADAGGGTNVGYLDAGDWLEYKVNVAAAGDYNLDFRVAALAAVGQLKLLLNGTTLLTQNLPVTGGWQSWQTVSTTVNLAAGEQTIRLNITTGNFNINWMNFTSAVNVAPTVSITSPLNNASFNAPASITISANATDADGTIASVRFYQGTVLLSTDNTAPYNFTWNNVGAGTYAITASATDNDGAVTSSSIVSLTVALPGTEVIQAESYSAMAGVVIDNTGDTGGGQHIGYIDAGDWMAYTNITFPTSGNYTIEYRVASLAGGKLSSDLNGGAIQLGVIDVPATGGWQTWTTISQTVTVDAGTYSFGIYAPAGGWNINWFRITKQNTTLKNAQLTSLSNSQLETNLEFYPNPATSNLFIKSSADILGAQASIYDAIGMEVLNISVEQEAIDVSFLTAGIYTIVVSKAGNSVTRRFVKK